ncbi:unnamed protein product [Clonostachys rosea]|uniref:Uncharacterized protein n=1 Tax=Bionectria ochroleuca TaxID=29856 RepID=A0ABY6UZT5_BIOOC|nr:unnamed protein product [Clonostachys rosea]
MLRKLGNIVARLATFSSPSTSTHPSTPPHPPTVCSHRRRDSESSIHPAAMQDAASPMTSQVVQTSDEYDWKPLSSEPVILAMEEVQSVSSDTESSGPHMVATTQSSPAPAVTPLRYDQVPLTSDGTADVNFLLGASDFPLVPRRLASVPSESCSEDDIFPFELSDVEFTHAPRVVSAALSNNECSNDISSVDSTQGLNVVCDLLQALHISPSLPKTNRVVDGLESIDPTLSSSGSPPPEMVCDLPQGDGHLTFPRLGIQLQESDADADTDGDHDGPGVMARRRRPRRTPRLPKPWRRTPAIPGSSPEFSPMPTRSTPCEGAAIIRRRRRPAPEDDSDEALEATARTKRRRQGQATNAWRAIPPLPSSSFEPPAERRL